MFLYAKREGDSFALNAVAQEEVLAGMCWQYLQKGYSLTIVDADFYNGFKGPEENTEVNEYVAYGNAR